MIYEITASIQRKMHSRNCCRRAKRKNTFNKTLASCLFDSSCETVNNGDGRRTTTTTVSMATEQHKHQKDLAAVAVFSSLLKKCHRHFEPLIFNCKFIFTVSLLIGMNSLSLSLSRWLIDKHWLTDWLITDGVTVCLRSSVQYQFQIDTRKYTQQLQFALTNVETYVMRLQKDTVMWNASDKTV